MLFKTTPEIQKFLPVVGTTDFATMSIFIAQAERDYIIPFISQQQYDDLNTAYQANSMNTAQTALLAKIQPALAQYFFYLWIPSAQLSIGTNGIRIANTSTMKTAFQWQIDELANSVMKAAGSAMEALLAFMEANSGDYTYWLTSSAYVEFKECFITSAEEFTDYIPSLGGSRLNFLAIRAAMKKVQEFTINEILGDDYYNELQSQFEGDTLTNDNDIIITFIKKALAPLTMAKAVTELSVMIDERGILNFANTRNTDSKNLRTPAATEQITKLEEMCKGDGKAYLDKMMAFIYANIEDYATFKASSTWVDPTVIPVVPFDPTAKTIYNM